MTATHAGDKKPDCGTNSATSLDILLVSDATGGLAKHMVASVLTQFGDLIPNLRLYAFCDTEQKLRERLVGIGARKALVFSTLASRALKTTVEEICLARRIPHFDLTGGCVEFIEHSTGFRASNDVSAVHRHDTAYFKRIDALEFSLQHDDSRRIESIHQAEIVLVGISRVSKTPTTAYLGWLGYRVANVSIVPTIGVPEELETCQDKSVALTMRPKKLAEIRNRRLAVNGLQEQLDQISLSNDYTDLKSVIREVMESEQIYRELGIPIIDTSDSTIEETAAKVLDALGRS